MLLGTVVNFVEKVSLSVGGHFLKVGGMVYAYRPEFMIILQAIDGVTADRRKFLEKCRSDPDVERHSKNSTTRKQTALLAAADA